MLSTDGAYAYVGLGMKGGRGCGLTVVDVLDGGTPSLAGSMRNCESGAGLRNVVDVAVGADGGAALVYVVAGKRAGVEADDDVGAEAALTLIHVSNKYRPRIRATQNLWPGGTYPTALEVSSEL